MRGLVRGHWMGIMLAAGVAASLGTDSKADAQVPVVTTVNPVATAGVTYVPERRGLFGRRVVYRPYLTPVAPVAAPVATTTVTSPVVSQRVIVERPATVIAPPVATPYSAGYIPPVTVQRPSVVPLYRPIFGY